MRTALQKTIEVDPHVLPAWAMGLELLMWPHRVVKCGCQKLPCECVKNGFCYEWRDGHGKDWCGGWMPGQEETVKAYAINHLLGGLP